MDGSPAPERPSIIDRAVHEFAETLPPTLPYPAANGSQWLRVGIWILILLVVVGAAFDVRRRVDAGVTLVQMERVLRKDSRRNRIYLVELARKLDRIERRCALRP